MALQGLNCRTWVRHKLVNVILEPFILGKIRRVLNKTQTTPYKRHIKTRLTKDASYRRIVVGSSSSINRVLAKFQTKCAVYTGKFDSYLGTPVV